MPTINLISAVGTPLNPDESLHVDSLDRLLSLQWNAGIDGVLVAGTMGLMQLLREQTYAQLIEHSIELSRGKGELLVGIGDAGFAVRRTALDISTDSLWTEWWRFRPTLFAFDRKSYRTIFARWQTSRSASVFI